MVATTKAQKHPLWAPANKRMEQGSAALTVRNRIQRGDSVPLWAIKAASIKPISAPKAKKKR